MNKAIFIQKHQEVYGYTITDAGAIVNFHAANNSASFKFKEKITGKTAANSRKGVEIMVPLKYLSNFWRKLSLIGIHSKQGLTATRRHWVTRKRRQKDSSIQEICLEGTHS